MKKLLLTYLFLVPSLMAFGQITYNVTTITELRNAIISANSDGAVSIINLENASYTVGRFGNGPDGGGIAFPEITENFDLIINGDESDITVATTGTYRLFYVTSTGRLILNKLFLYNGQPEDDYAAGAVYNEGYLEANNVLFQGHRSGGNDGNNAGAIYNEGDAYFRTCEFVSNVAQGLGGLRGGAIFNTGLSSTLTVEQCTFYQNSAIGRGSALGINNGSVDVINSTFYENTDEAIYLAGGQLVLNSCTISGNEANNFGGDNGTVVNEGGSLFLRYNIIGQNETSGGSLVITDPNVYDIKGSFTDFGYNVIGQFNTGSLAGTSVNTSILFFDFPGFGYNGSSIVRTIPILASSPALDFVPTSQGSLPGYDQRGYVYEGAAADAGAYELNGTTITSIATGNWSEAGIWSNNDGPFSSLPTIIATGTVVTMNQNGSTGGLEIDGGGNLNAGTFNLSISGDFNASTSPSNSLANLSNANIFFSNVATYTDPVGLDFGNVTVSGSSLDLANPLRARSMTINNTRTLNANGNIIEIFGTGGTVWSQLGTFNPGGAGQTVTFTGAAPTINGTNFQNLTINSSGTATSLNDLTMAEQLDVTAGSFVGGVLVQTNGDITINTTGNVDQSDMDSQGGNISVISSAGSLTLGDVTSDAGAITLNAAVNINSAGQNVAAGGGDLNFNVGGDIFLSAFSSASISGGGDINAVVGGDMTLTTGIDASGDGTGPGNITLNITGSLLATDGDLNITSEGQGGGNLTLNAFDISPLLDLSFSGPAGGGGSVSVTTTGTAPVVFSDIDVSGASDSGDIDLVLGGGFTINSNINMFSAFSNSSFTATVNGLVTVQNIDTSADGNAGDISITTTGAVVAGDLSADGVGTGGIIDINAGGDIATGVVSSTILFGGGNGGNVTIGSTSGSVQTTSIATNNAGGSGNGGNVTINSSGTVTVGTVNTSCPDIAGSLNITAAGDISLTGFSAGSGGDAGTLNISSTGGDVTITNAISLNAPNDGGQIDITANNGLVTVSDLTSSSSFADGPITITAGSISAGNINTNNNVRLEALSGNALAGNIATTGQGGGDITVISSANTSLGSLTADSFDGVGGTVDLTSAGDIILGSVSASSGNDNGGNIIISADGNIDSPNPNISLNASGTVNFSSGGSISITSQGQILDPLVLDASGDATGGSVNINSANTVIMNTLDLGAQFTGGSIIADIGGDLTFNVDLDLESTDAFGSAGDATFNIAGDLIFAPSFGIAASAPQNAGTVDITVGNNASIGAIEMSSQDANGGTLNIAATTGQVAFDYINTQSTNADGGSVTLSAFTNVIGSASFSNLNGNNASISTVGATSSGSVFISHNDGNPQDFEISQGATSNGLFSSLAADPLVASDNFLNSTVVGGNYTSGDTRVVIRSPGPPFVTTWQTTTPGESITVPTLGGPYLYDVDWGDGSPVETGFTGNAQHNYATAGTYTVSISGTFPRIYFADGGDKDKIRTIEQWGNIAWTSMGQAFQGCSNLTYNASDVPDLTLVTDISLMFAGATSFNGDISAWNTTGITFMLGTFSGATSFNQNLTGWNVSNVTTMQELFSGATSFNNGEAPGASGSPLSWTTTSLQNTNAMFLGASSFNQNVNSWDVSGVTDMFRMFESATVFNQPLNTWDVSLVTSMGSMFKNATAFNQPLNSATWNTANVVNFGEMFFGASAFDQPLDNNWSVASTVNLVQMFAFATSFNQPLNQWGATKPSNAPIVLMFEGATSFNQPLSAWNVSGTDNMFGIFKNAAAFDQDLSGWDVTGVTVAGASMEELFDNSGMSPTSYDATLLGWSAQTVQPNITLGALGLNYCDPTGRDILTNATNSWTINDNGGLIDPAAVPQASQLIICDGDSFDFNIGSGVQTGYTYKLYSSFVDLGNRGNEIGTWTEGTPLSAVTLTAGSNGIVVGDNLLIVVAEDNSSICEVILDASLTITVNPLPTVAISGDATICEGESTDLLFTLTGTGPYDVTYNDGTVDVDLIGISDGHLESVAPTSATTYTLISVADANNCSPATVTGSVQVTVNPLPTVAIGGDATICEGESTDLLFTLTGTGPYDVTYNDGTVDVDLIGISNGHLESVTPTSTTTYTLISVADANNCSPATVTGSAVVTVNLLPTVAIGGDATICEGESTDLLFTLTGAGPFDVTYNDGTVDIDLIGISDGHLESVAPTSTTTYTLISVADANSCSPATVTGLAEVTVNPLPTVAISGDVTICDGESTDLLFTLTGTGSFDVTYNDGTVDVDLIGISDGHLESVAPTSTTTYTLISVVDANSCSPVAVTGSATVTINPAPTVSISGDATICEGESTDLLFTLTGAGPYDVTYNDGSNDINLTSISDGHLEPVTPTVTTTYTLVSLVDANNCSSSGVAGSVTVTVNPLPVITLDAQGPFCLTDATTDLVATPSGGTWSGTGITDAATGTFDPAGVGAGTYTITYEISENGCTDFASIEVSVLDTPDASINPAGPFCTSDAPVNLTSVNSGGTWSGSGITDQAAGTFDPNQSGTGLITVTYTLELGGCSDVQTLNIEVNESPEVVIGEVSAICISDAPITLTATPSGGIWSGPGITDANNGTFDPTVAGLGTSTISYSVNNNGCSGESEIEIEILSLPENATAINGPDFLCTGDEALYTTTAISGATQYEWQTPSGTIVTDLP
ncbi:BspA family leucine-rich repeat surface protein, partial [Fulvivirga sp.]